MLCDDEGRDWNSAAASLRMPEMKLGRAKKGFSPSGFKQYVCAGNTLILDSRL